MIDLIGENMALAIDTIKGRLKEAFGLDSQETVGKKLNITQGNVSRLQDLLESETGSDG